MAIAALVCGIVSVVFAFFGYGAIVGIIVGIVAIVLGILARKDPQRKGMATAGLILGIIGTVLSGVLLIACVACVNALSKAGTDLLENSDLQELRDALDEAKTALDSL
jgi:type II secretory pathway component PulF